MLIEIESVKQQLGEGFCRWFQDEYFDLYVWTNPSGGITGFQLCYDRLGNESAITWQSRSGFSHEKIDPGDQNPLKNMTPILVQNGIFPRGKIVERFKASSKRINTDIAGFVMKQLLEYCSLSQGIHQSPASGS